MQQIFLNFDEILAIYFILFLVFLISFFGYIHSQRGGVKTKGKKKVEKLVSF